MRTILIDDELNNLQNLKTLLGTYCKDVSVIGEASNGREGLELINLLNPDLVFLDIEMPGLSGFELLSQVQNFQFEVIFVTAFSNYAIKAFKFNALDYILKPIDIEELLMAVDRAKRKISDKSQLENTQLALQNLRLPATDRRIALASTEKIDFFDVNSIIRCVGENNYTRFFFENGETRLVSKPLSEYEDLLDEYGFIRVHKSHLVNRSKIASYVKKDGGWLITSDGASVPVSRRKKDELFKRIDV